jgi:hypothetical protein
MSNLTTNAPKKGATKTSAVSSTSLIALAPIKDLTLQSESLGTLYSTFGADAEVTIHNISNTKKRVFLTVSNAEGLGQNFYLSTRLSELVRDREVTISEVMFNPITLETTSPNPETQEYDENYVKNDFYVINVVTEKFKTKIGESKVRKPKSLSDYANLS